MATAKKIQSDISSLKVAIRVAKNDAIKKKLKSRLEMAENELASIKSGAKPRKVSTTKGTKSLLERAKALVKKNPKFAQYKGSGVDLEKDAKEGARETGRRISKGIKGNQYASKKEAKGNVYYEYRVNRLDVKQPKGKQSYPKLEDGGYMAKGGMTAHGLQVGDEIIGHSDNNVVVKDKISKKIYVININNGTRLSEEEFEKLGSRGRTKFSKMANGGSIYGIEKYLSRNLIEHITSLNEEQLKKMKKELSNEIERSENYDKDFKGSNREFALRKEMDLVNYRLGEGKMAHGGETHRADDPEVEIDEDEMKVVRGYSDDEAYEYAKGGMTLKAGDIVEATTGVKLKVMDFKPDFGGRALVQRIDEFGEGLKPAWMPLTKFKLPKLI